MASCCRWLVPYHADGRRPEGKLTDEEHAANMKKKKKTTEAGNPSTDRKCSAFQTSTWRLCRIFGFVRFEVATIKRKSAVVLRGTLIIIIIIIIHSESSEISTLNLDEKKIMAILLLGDFQWNVYIYLSRTSRRRTEKKNDILIQRKSL